MSSDIVEQLREMSREYGADDIGGWCGLAADTIEQLRAALVRATSECNALSGGSHYQPHDFTSPAFMPLRGDR